MLHFERIILSNWKNFGEINIDLSNRMFFIGANATGKSNLLDAFRFLKDMSMNGLQKAIAVRGGIKSIRNLNARKKTSIEIDVFLKDPSNEDKWEYRIAFNASGGKNEKRDVTIIFEEISKNSKKILDRKYNDSGEDYLSRQFTYLEQPAMNVNYRELYTTFKSITYVNIIPQLIRESETFIPTVAREDYYGRDLLAHISETSIRTRESRLKVITKILKLAVPQFYDLQYVQDEKGKPHLQVKYEHFRPQGAFQKEDQFSDGTLRLIGIIWAILDGEGLMLLEEPELYLNSEIVRQLPMFIANAQKAKSGRQVFLSSHSYDLLDTDTILSTEVAVLEQGKESTIVSLADDIPAIKEKLAAKFTLADAVIPHVTPKGVINGQLSMFDKM